jgi:hypothetical protein
MDDIRRSGDNLVEDLGLSHRSGRNIVVAIDLNQAPARSGV